MIRRSWRHANAVERGSGTDLNSIGIHFLQQYWDCFWSKGFTAFDVLCLPQSVLHNDYTQQGQEFLESCERIDVSKVRVNANVVGSHVFYKTNALHHGRVCCKARIVTHGNYDNEKSNHRADSVMCSLTGIHVQLSICVLRR